MNFLKISIITLLFSLTSHAATVENYNYPYTNSYLATLTYEIIKSNPKIAPVVYKIPGMTSRDNIPLLEKRDFTQVNTYRQSGPAPLAFLIAGTGGDSSDPGLNRQAQELYKIGYSAIILPSPMN